MSDDRSTDRNTDVPRNVLADLIIPVMALAFAVYYLSTITAVPWIAQASAVLVSGLLALSILAFAIRTFLRIRAGREVIRMSGLGFEAGIDLKRLGLLALAVAYVWLIGDLGFTIATLGFLFLAILLLSSLANWKNAALVATGCALIGYFIFILVFETRFPQGPVERFLEPYAKSIRQVFNGR